jgi:hypothetical protein
MLLWILIQSRSTVRPLQLLLLTILLSLIKLILFHSLCWIWRSFCILPFVISTCTWLPISCLWWFCTCLPLFQCILLQILSLFTTLLSLLRWLLLWNNCTIWFLLKYLEWLLWYSCWVIRILWHSIYVYNLLFFIIWLSIIIYFICWSANLFSLRKLFHSYLIKFMNNMLLYESDYDNVHTTSTSSPFNFLPIAINTDWIYL